MKKRYYSICVILWVLITTLSATSPTTFHIALKKIYPHAMNVSWSQQGNYYVASFTQNGFEKKVWMNGNAQWVMTNTNLQLFYTLNGRLVQTRDVSYINPTLSPGIFNF